MEDCPLLATYTLANICDDSKIRQTLTDWVQKRFTLELQTII